eukprot:CAMPEP_0113539424 /NCGR_PEP_ID=MMETSP0015_2-20120614/7908_1 /TAXON_ID=2838 /ORGANISM="Odontella" /LENGTH=505 /DNA_ID=CAMNT_0000439097 /DNA_START=237 /DNA_END=1754 /DNA_ORIENTATION=+ /assembly_acc=CAM_ASM_000160
MSGTGRKGGGGGGGKKGGSGGVGGGGSAKKKKAARKAANAAEAARRDVNVASLEALKRLSVALSELDETGGKGKGEGKDGHPRLSHWRTLPPDVQSAYKMMDDGSELIRATSTKYTLVGKVDVDEGAKMSPELLRGCELLAAGALVLFDDSSSSASSAVVIGCSRSARRYARASSRSCVAAVTALVKSFVDGTALNANVGARLTGAAWSACDASKKMPRGNRACARRELMTWAGECGETIGEFEELLELGPAAAAAEEEAAEEAESEVEVDDGAYGRQASAGSAGWDDFCGGAGTGEQYSAVEIPLVRACLALVKCSRGTIKVALEASEYVGSAVEKEDAAAAEKAEEEEEEKDRAKDQDDQKAKRETRRRRLNYIGTLVELARQVGDGMTELGSLLYPPLSDAVAAADGEEQEEDSELERRIELQRMAIVALHDCVLGGNGGDGEEDEKKAAGDDNDDSNEAAVKVSKEIASHSSKIRSAAEKRATEARTAAREIARSSRRGKR